MGDNLLKKIDRGTCSVIELILDSINETVYVADPETYEILYVNKNLQDLFEKDLVGGICYREFQGLDSPCEFCTNEIIFMEKGKPYNWEHYNPLLKKHFMIVDKIIKWPDGRDVRFESAVDITRRKVAEEARGLRLEYEETLRRISSRFVGNYNINDAIDFSLADIGRFSNASRSYVFCIRPDGAYMDNTHEWCSEGVSPEIHNLQNLPNSIFPWWMDKLHRGEVIHVTDVSDLPAEANSEKEILESQGIKSLLVLPLHVKGELFGFIGFDNVRETGLWSQDDLANLMVSSEIIGNAFEHQRVVQALQKSEAKYKELANSLPEVVFEIDLKGNLIYTNHNAYEFFGYLPEEVGKDFNVFKSIVPADRQRVHDNITRLLVGDKLGWNEYTAIKKDGSTFPVAIHSSVFFDKNKPVGFRGIMLDMTERKQYLESLRASEAKWRAVFDSANDAIFIHDVLTGAIIDVNQKMTEMFGYSLEEVKSLNIGLTTSEPPYTQENAIAYISKAAQGKPQLFEWKAKHKGGHLFWVEVNLKRAIIEGKERVLAIVRDISDRKQSEEEMRCIQEHANFLADALEKSSQPFISCHPDFRIMTWNRAFCELLGFTNGELTNINVHKDLTPTEWQGDELNRFKELVDTGKPQRFEKEYFHKDGSRVSVEVLMHKSSDSEGNTKCYYTFVTDITERKMVENQLKYLATHDTLTNIPNRYTMEEALRRAVVKARRGQKSALLLIDIDHFKLVNDTEGHAAGDDLLIRIASILKQRLRKGDLLARFGGDEFAVLLEEADSEQAGVVAEKLRRAVNEGDLSLPVHKSLFTLSISIGIVIIDGTLEPQKLLSLADTALYSAKEGGRNRFCIIRTEEDAPGRLS